MGTHADYAEIKEIGFDLGPGMPHFRQGMKEPEGNAIARARIVRCFAAIAFLVCASCGKDPKGRYVGEISDWNTEVFEAKSLRIEGQDYSLRLTLRQVGEERPAELIFRHRATDKEKVRSGLWEMGDGNRTIAFADGEDVQEYYLYKQGSRFIFQDRWGLVDDNGSLIRLMRNNGRSRKRSFPLAFTFESGGSVRFTSKAFPKGMAGEWELIDGRVVANFLDEPSGERQKYFMSWAGETLKIDKLTVYMPFFQKYYLRAPDETESTGPFSADELREGVQAGRFTKKHLASHDKRKWIPVAEVKGFVEGSKQLKRKNWMYHTKFEEPPLLKPR